MLLSKLLEALPRELAVQRREGHGDPVIRGLCTDSRQVVPGDLFVALRGADADGHDFLAQALELGAVALLVESIPQPLGERIPPALPRVQVPDTRRALAPLAAAFFGAPARELRLVGITGTNGKTSTSYLIESMLQAAGVATGLIGTVELRYAGERQRAVNTTPESLELQRSLRAMRTLGVEAVVLEVSSHGLALGRVDGCRFGVVAMTNVTQDHLDFHPSMDAYRAAKTRLFSEFTAPEGVAVVNLDDRSAGAFEAAAAEAGARLLRVSRRAHPRAEVQVAMEQVALEGSRAILKLPSGSIPVELPLVGDFNLENLAVAAGAGHALGLDPEAIAEGAARCPQVPGRVERVEIAGVPGPTVLVDYAHTPDAVDKLLRALRPLGSGRLVTVFGCGGDRDRSKRPQMAQAVARWSDLALATSDNPRTEDPEQILDDLEPGLAGLRRVAPEQLADAERAYARLADRQRAIELAVELGQPGDIVVLAGKGHEDYQIVGREKRPFDDREQAIRALRRRSTP